MTKLEHALIAAGATLCLSVPVAQPKTSATPTI